MSLIRISVLPAITLAPPLISRKSTTPKLVSAFTDPPTPATVTDAFWPRTVTSFPMREVDGREGRTQIGAACDLLGFDLSVLIPDRHAGFGVPHAHVAEGV